jgi:uncharacterized protein (TIGR03083 family)
MDSIYGAYLRTRERVTDLLATVDEAELARRVPACPEWSVEDLLAHLVSMPAAISSGRMPAGPIAEWLQELIDERADQPVGDLIVEWQAMDGELQALLNGGAALLFADLAIHEHDLRGALGRPDHSALEVDEVLPRALAAFSKPLREAGLGAIEVRAGGDVWRSHDAAVGWTLLVDPWTAVRAVNSRRTAEELRRLPSLGDETPYLAVLHDHLPLPAESLHEQ